MLKRWMVAMLGLWAWVSLAQANHYLPPQLDALILSGKHYLYQGDFQKARNTFLLIEKQYPDYPHGYFYTAYLTLLVYSQNLSSDSLRQALETQIQVAGKVAKAFRKNGRENADALFHQGLIDGLKGVRYVLERSYLKAYWYGRKAIRYLQEVQRLDPAYNDVYLGLGVFHYYVDLLPRMLRVVAHVLGFEGDRELGKQQLRKASFEGHYFREEARLMYTLFMYFMEGEMVQSVAQLKHLVKQYPGNPIPRLLLGYHYRRTGKLEKALKIFRETPEIYPDLLPQMVNVKYYNMAAIYFEMNNFSAADSLLDYLMGLPTRKSIYYQSAIRFYKGLISDLQFQREQALQYYRKIPRHKQSKYWYNAVQMFYRFPMDSLMRQYIMARNLYLGLKFSQSLSLVEAVLKKLEQRDTFQNPDLPYLLKDLQAMDYFFLGNPSRALQLYEQLEKELSHMRDAIRKSWVYIHYAKVLYSRGYFQKAEDMLNQANDVDDDYTHLIIKREEIIMERMRTRHQ